MKMSGTRYYQQFDGDYEDSNHENVMVHVVPDSGTKSKWNHIEDLDAFFTRVYVYHQQHGFVCMMLNESLQLLQFAFVVGFSSFLLKCVNYNLLFRNEVKINNGTKITLADVISNPGECVDSFGPVLWTCLIVAFSCWALKLVSVVYHFFQYAEIRNFYRTALHIDDQDLDNLTWHDIQQKIRAAQLEFQMCIHKSELTELDIYHRILRFKNYLVAMINKSVFPLKFNVPVIGETIYFSHSLKYNIEFLLFWGPWAPFDNSWHLREDFKRSSLRHEHAQKLANYIGYVGLANLVLAPLILLWQFLYAFFSYAELVKREPGSLGVRKWSLYGRIYLRHFNELDHELQARLSRAYRPATLYLSGFSSNFVAILARNVAFLAGAILAVIVILTVYDEDVITVEHVLTLMTVLGAVVAGCRVLIPDENLVWCPESLLDAVLAQVHYLPVEWKGKAHTANVRGDLSKLFQFKAVYLLEELLSPLITPFILVFVIRPKALEIVDFLRQFTVEVVGVGDVCSFAQLDIHKHGHPQWQSSVRSEADAALSFHQEDLETSRADQHLRAEDGKTELSLIHFALTNPEWRPTAAAEEFFTALKSQIQQELTSTSPYLESSLLRSLHGMNPVTLHSLLLPPVSTATMNSLPAQAKSYFLQGRGVTKIEGPRIFPECKSLVRSVMDGPLSDTVWEEVAISEPVATNMAMSTLYFHDVIHRRTLQVKGTKNPAQAMPMPDIKESPDEDDHAGATAALNAAVINLQTAAGSRMAKSN